MTQVKPKTFLPMLIMLALLIVAAGVRFHDIGVQSLWYDEGVAYGHSQRNLFELIPALRNNVHVPAYFATLSLWENFAGSTEFGLRMYSALWSIVGVAGIYALGKRLYSPIAGLAAAAFVALNTFSIYYAQETRMYAMLATVAILSMWIFAGLMQRLLAPFAGVDDEPPNHTRNLWLWGWALMAVNTIGVYTHFAYALVMLTQGVMTVLALGNLMWRYMQQGFPFSIWLRAFGIYFVVNLVTLILFSPWLFVAISQVSAQPNISETVSNTDMALIIQGWLAYGITFRDVLSSMGFVVYFFLVFGLLTPDNSKPRAWWQLLLPIVWVLISVGVYAYLGLYTRYLRFLLPAQMGFALWMGRGAWMLWYVIPRAAQSTDNSPRTIIARNMPKIAAFVAVAAFCYTLAQGIPPLYSSEEYQRDDYRQLATTIMNESEQGDAIILSAPGLQEIFGYYYDGDLPIFPLPAGENIVADTQLVVDEYNQIFVVLYGNAEQDPDGIVTSTLNQEAYPINTEWIDNIRLARYDASFATFETVDNVDARFGDHIQLERYALTSTTLSPDDVLQIELYWVTDAALDRRYKVFVQLLNPDGTLALQRDTEPVNGQALTTLWQAGETIQDNHALHIPADAATGEYTLIVGLYDGNPPNERLPVGDGDYLDLGKIVIED